MKYKILLFISLCLVLIVAFLVTNQRRVSNNIFSNFGVRIPSNYDILGIDVSHHQGDIDWLKALKMTIKGDSIQFVYLKMTEGTNFIDPLYNYNRKQLDLDKVKMGVYHFYSPNQSAIKQANFFCENLKKHH